MKKRYITAAIFGVICIVLGFYYGVSLWVLYKKQAGGDFHFPNGSGLEALGSALSGTVGLLFSLASVIFFTISLLQTTDEMSQTRNLIQTQLAQSTFFNLLRHQRELFVTRPNFESIINTIKNSLTAYRNCISSHEFKDFGETANCPEALFANYAEIKILSESLVNISNFIFEQLGDDDFYHKTYFLSLSENEKSFFGFVLRNKLESDAYGTFNFDYSQKYNSESSFINRTKSPDFPLLIFDGFKMPPFFISYPIEAKEQQEAIEKQTKLLILGMKSPELSLEKIYYKCVYATHLSPTVSEDQKRLAEVEGTQSYVPGENPTLYPIFAQTLWQIIGVSSDIRVRVNFIFRYKGQKFAIGWRRMQIDISKLADEDIIKFSGAQAINLHEKHPSAKVLQIHIKDAGLFP
jgi:hypothetical protein